MSPRTRTRTGRGGRIVILLVVVGCLVLAAVVDRTGSSDSTAAPATAALGPRAPSLDAVETAWYCAEGTSTPGGRADERIYVANIDRRTARVRISVMQGPDVSPKVVDTAVAAGTLASFRVADILAIAEPGVVVEVTGGRAVVTHSITGNGDAAVGPCSHDAALQWHFAAGTTVRGAQLYLALFNPFADDAIVDIDFLTDLGPLAPGDLQGFVVPAHSRVTIPVQDEARRQNLVATEVSARRGRVVAEQSQLLDGTDGRKGLALSLGAPELSTHWEFAQATIADGRTQTMVIANPSTVPTAATVRTRLDGGALEPETVNVPGRTAVAVDLGARVPAGIGFSVAVTGRSPVIAESFLSVRSPIAASERGIATAIGSNRASRWWVDAPARVDGGSRDTITVLNPGAARVTARVTVMRAGRITVLSTAGHVQLAAGKRAVLDLGALGVPTDAFVIVNATGRVVVDRESSAIPGVTAASAIPDLDRSLTATSVRGEDNACNEGGAGTPWSMREREAKLVVPDDFRMPAPEDLASHVDAGVAEMIEQGAIYFDTEDLRLTRSGVSLRFRSDDGWTVKLPESRSESTLVRIEHHFAGAPGSPPPAASELVRAWTRTEPLIEVARITTHRGRVVLHDAQGRPLAELDDDQVTGSASIATKTRFREIEVELAAGAPARVLDALVDSLHAAGAASQPSMSKVARVLGEAAQRPPDLADAPLRPDATTRALVRATMLRSVVELLERDPRLRLSDDVETVHKARVATRRLRSDLKTFRPILERSWSEPFRAELAWLGGLLGHVRDADVLLGSLSAMLSELPDELRAGGAGLTDQLRATHARDRDALLEAMRSPRYARLLEWLVAGTNDPRLRPKAESERADRIAGRLTGPPRRKLARRVARLGPRPTNGDLHAVRKQAKQARYAIEAVAPIAGGGQVAKQLARLQDVLGDHQDTVVATAWLLAASRDAATDRDGAFVAGVLAGILIGERDRARGKWRKAWKRAR